MMMPSVLLMSMQLLLGLRNRKQQRRFGRCSLSNRLPLVSCLKFTAPNLFLASKLITLAVVVGTIVV